MQLRKRLILAALTGTFIACAGIYWFFNRSNSGITNFFVIVFTVLAVLFALFQWLLPQSSESHNIPASSAAIQEPRTSYSPQYLRPQQRSVQPQFKEAIAWYEWVQIIINTFFDMLDSIEKLLLYPMIGLIPASFLYLGLLVMGLDKTPLANVLFLSVFIVVGGAVFLADYVSAMKRAVAIVREVKRQERLEQLRNFTVDPASRSRR